MVRWEVNLGESLESTGHLDYSTGWSFRPIKDPDSNKNGGGNLMNYTQDCLLTSTCIHIYAYMCTYTQTCSHTQRRGKRERFNWHKTGIFTKIFIEFITRRARGSPSNKVMHDLIQTLVKTAVGLLAAVMRQTWPSSWVQGKLRREAPMTLLPSPWPEEVQVPEGCAAVL